MADKPKHLRVDQSETRVSPSLKGQPRSLRDSSTAATKRKLPAYNRIKDIRQQQGLSLRTLSSRMGIPESRLESEEHPTTDLTVSQLIRWQKAMDVPLVSLIDDEEDGLSAAVRHRAKLILIMKTANSLATISKSARVQRLCEMLRNQLIELMPELAEITGWPNHSSRRGKDVVGRTVTDVIDTKSMDK